MSPTFTDYHRAGELMFGTTGADAYDAFAEINAEFFHDMVPLMPITWHHSLPHGRALGLAGHDSIAMGIYRNAFPLLEDDGRLTVYARHILLHEMIHQHLRAAGRQIHHESDDWCDELMRIGPMLGIRPFLAQRDTVAKVVVNTETKERKSVRKQRGDLTRKQRASFPHFAFDYPAGTLKPEWSNS